MARFIIKNKVYDTTAMEHIGTVRKWYAFRGWLQQQLCGSDKGYIYDCDLYRSTKGNYLLVHDDDLATVGEAITENEAKQLLMHSNYDKYVELYGSLEEA